MNKEKGKTLPYSRTPTNTHKQNDGIFSKNHHLASLTVISVSPDKNQQQLLKFTRIIINRLFASLKEPPP